MIKDTLDQRRTERMVSRICQITAEWSHRSFAEPDLKVSSPSRLRASLRQVRTDGKSLQVAEKTSSATIYWTCGALVH